ncbi:HIT family protein [Candidatus Woesearchaeota archaeon]|nr:HIT family protein [Candidatus Woesearchaeota archaeon]
MTDCIQRKSEISEHTIKDCVFCKIIKGDMPCAKIYEDDEHFAMLDINPIAKGHALVMPKKHAETPLQMDDESHCRLQKAVMKVAKGIKEGLLCDGLNIFVNIKKAGGQEVPHVHYHIVPRFITDDQPFKAGHTEYVDMEIDKFKKKIREAIK